MNKIISICMAIAVICLLSGIFLYPYLPQKIPTHWNIHDEIDGWSSKAFGIILFPGFMLIMIFLFWYLPKIDPMKKNIQKFQKYYDWFCLAIILFFAYLFILTMFASFGTQIKMSAMMVPALAVIFLLSAVLMRHSKRNWFIGIRTPWTMSDDRVWEKTNKMGSWLFAVLGILFLIAVLLPVLIMLFIIGLAILFVIFLFFYSYWIFRKIRKR
jgi:uncharacterized membrane protein